MRGPMKGSGATVSYSRLLYSLQVRRIAELQLGLHAEGLA